MSRTWSVCHCKVVFGKYMYFQSTGHLTFWVLKIMQPPESIVVSSDCERLPMTYVGAILIDSPYFLAFVRVLPV